MDAKTALQNIVGLLSDYQSFAEGFDHSDHGDQEYGAEDEGCRFEQYDIDESLKVIADLITASQDVVEHFAVMDSIDDDDLASIDRLVLAVAPHTHDVKLASSESDGENRFYLKCECGWESDYFVHPEVRQAGSEKEAMIELMNR